MFSRDGAPGLKPSLFQIRYGDISLRYYDNPERSCAGVYKIETHAWAPRIPWHLTSGEKQMNLKYKELRRKAPTRNIMESKHTEAARPEGRRTAFEERAKLGGGFLKKELYWGGLLDKRAILEGLFDERAILRGLFDETSILKRAFSRKVYTGGAFWQKGYTGGAFLRKG